MKKKACFIVFIFFLFSKLSAQSIDYKNPEVTRLYIFGMISFYVKYEMYCSAEAVGYFKYPANVGDKEYFFTYEGIQFYKQSMFDENFYIYRLPLPANLWTNSRGELMLFRKAFAPVTNADRKALNFPYGYAHDFK